MYGFLYFYQFKEETAMLAIIKTLILIKYLGWKIHAYKRWKKKIDKRFAKIVKKSKWLDEKIFKTTMDRSYANQNIHTDKIWEERAEREAHRLNL